MPIVQVLPGGHDNRTLTARAEDMPRPRGAAAGATGRPRPLHPKPAARVSVSLARKPNSYGIKSMFS